MCIRDSSLVGDIALTKDDLSSFAIGLLAFLAAHVAYVVAFLPLGFSAVGLSSSASCWRRSRYGPSRGPGAARFATWGPGWGTR